MRQPELFCHLLAAALALSCAACGASSLAVAQDSPAGITTSSDSNAVLPYTAEDAFFASLPTGGDARTILCAPPVGQDIVVGKLCVSDPPVLRGIKDLQSLLGMGFTDPSASGSNGGSDGNPAYALTGHSSSLVVNGVSQINPRTILCKDYGPIQNAAANMLPNPNFFACMGFTRGENIVEVATTDAGTGILNFYIIRFETACSLAHTCTAGDVLTPAVEKNWLAYNAYEDDPFLKNTILDCRQCHQPNNDAQPVLRLQETTAPYTHFFSSKTSGGQTLLSDFWAAHGTSEDYGPVPAALIAASDGGKIAKFLADENFLNAQPNVFDSATIEAQVDASSPGQPASNVSSGKSAAWNTIFNQFQVGLQIPPPYHDVKISDANKLAALSASYVAVQNGTQQSFELADLRNIFPDDQTLLAQMGMAVVPGQNVQAILANACGQCHNSDLDQNLSRAKFNVRTLLAGQMSAAEKQTAVVRLQKAENDVLLMPPKRFRALQKSEVQALITYLEK